MKNWSVINLVIMPTLEDYIYDMEHRADHGGANNSEDLWSQLQQKEADLVLAAELGKALLEKNEELKKQQDAIVDEYSRKLEVRFKKYIYVFINIGFEVTVNRK